jgi:predicted permease
MYWIGVPVSIIGFLREVDLTGGIWIAPLVHWGAVGLGACLALGWLALPFHTLTSPRQRGSFQLASVLGNTGYIGFPICQAIGGSEYFGWAVFYDLLGTLFSAYGLGVGIASYFGTKPYTRLQVIANMIQSPSIWAFGVGLATTSFSFPEWVERGLYYFAWGMIPISLMVLGMRLALVKSWQSFGSASVALSIKLMGMPLVVGIFLAWSPLPELGKLMLILQAGMPPAIATLVLSEEFDLDRDITVCALALGYVLALITLPAWILIFHPESFSL